MDTALAISAPGAEWWKDIVNICGKSIFERLHIEMIFFLILCLPVSTGQQNKGTISTGCPFPRGSGDLIHKKCSNLTGNLGQNFENMSIQI